VAATPLIEVMVTPRSVERSSSTMSSSTASAVVREEACDGTAMVASTMVLPAVMRRMTSVGSTPSLLARLARSCCSRSPEMSDGSPSMTKVAVTTDEYSAPGGAGGGEGGGGDGGGGAGGG